MDILTTRKYSLKKQYGISIFLILFTALLCFFAAPWIGYRVVAFLLLLVVSVLAILFDIFPVLIAALLSALIWNFFFIPPVFNFHIGSPEDGLMFLMYFVIASINAVLTFKIREFEQKEQKERERLKSIALYNTLLNSLSHELRTPISAIIGAIDTLNSSENTLSLKVEKELYTEIETASLRLNRQVENLLSMSRLDAGILKPKLDWCDINELIFRILKNTEPDAIHHRIHFEPKENLPLCKTDRGFLEQIIGNLVYNALHHTPENSLILIEVDCQNNSCQFVVSDNGLGFPEKEIAFVFDKFYRLSHAKTGGIGLGLSIVKGFTEALNGKIILENQKNGGAKFTIILPVETTSLLDFDHE
ncbi:MAG: ATP-binding protein [Crocinitomicaceae bacterium]